MKPINVRTTLSSVAGFAVGLAFFGAPIWSQEKSDSLLQRPQPTRYTITDLGLVGSSPGPLVITNNGLIAESVIVSNDFHAAISFLGRMPIDLAKTGG